MRTRLIKGLGWRHTAQTSWIASRTHRQAENPCRFNTDSHQRLQIQANHNGPHTFEKIPCRYIRVSLHDSDHSALDTALDMSKDISTVFLATDLRLRGLTGKFSAFFFLLDRNWEGWSPSLLLRSSLIQRQTRAKWNRVASLVAQKRQRVQCTSTRTGRDLCGQEPI